MEMADRFDIPVLALVDTAGAYPGIDAEERGQAEAIARSTERLPQPRRAERRGDPRRRRLRRRHRDRHRQPRADAGARDLQRDLAGGRGLDPVARHRQGAGSRHQHEDHRAGPRAPRHHRRDRHRAARRRAPRSRRRRSRRPATRSPTRSPASRGSTARPCAASAATSSSRSAAACNSLPVRADTAGGMAKNFTGPTASASASR